VIENNHSEKREKLKTIIKMETNSNKGKIRVHPGAIKLLTDSTWEFAHNILWSDHYFSEAETRLAKTFIKEYYEGIPAERFSATASKHFTSYCERVLLAKRYVDRFPHRYIPHPCIWLNKNNPKGFAGTKSWHDSEQRKRRLQRLLSELSFLEESLQHYKSTINF
jgi:hypothetical protein